MSNKQENYGLSKALVQIYMSHTKKIVVEIKKKRKKPVRQKNFSCSVVYHILLFPVPFCKFNNWKLV